VDGAAVSPMTMGKLVSKAVEVGCDVCLLFGACHQGVTVDHCRSLLFDRAKKHNSDREKALKFIEAAETVAAKKTAFQNEAHTLWRKLWSNQLADSDSDDVKNRKIDAYMKTYEEWRTVWNNFVDAAQADIGLAVEKAKAAKIKLGKLKLEKMPEKVTINQEHEKKMWAQLDSVDEILNAAVSVQR